MEFLKRELKSFSRFELIFFLSATGLIALVSFYMKDSKIALMSALCGMSYTILAGKGKVYCYYIGILGTFCYCYLAFKNGFWGNLALFGLYYLPMEITGIFKWKKHLNTQKNEIYKTKLSQKERIGYFALAATGSAVLTLLLFLSGGKSPLFDGSATVFSILGQFLTVKRCIEQWYIWFFVNLLSLLMWLFAFLNGSGAPALIVMWACYLFLSVYFLKQWQKEV